EMLVDLPIRSRRLNGLQDDIATQGSGPQLPRSKITHGVKPDLLRTVRVVEHIRPDDGVTRYLRKAVYKLVKVLPFRHIGPLFPVMTRIFPVESTVHSPAA